MAKPTLQKLREGPNPKRTKLVDRLYYWRIIFQYQNDPKVHHDPIVAEAFIQEVNPAAAVARLHKFFVKWHKPERFGPPYPDIVDEAKSINIDKSDFEGIWKETQEKCKLKPKPIAVYYEYAYEGADLPFVFAIYPIEQIPNQPKE